MFIVLPLEISQWLAVYCHQYFIFSGATSSALWRDHGVAWCYPFVFRLTEMFKELLFFKNFLFDIFSKQWQLLKLPHWRYERKRNLWSFSFRKGWAIFLSNIPPIHFGWLAEWMHFRRTLCRPGRFGIETFKPVILLIIQQYIGFLQLASNLLLVFLSFCGWHLTPQFGTNCEYWPH